MPEYSGNKFDTYDFSDKYSDSSYWKDSVISLNQDVTNLLNRVKELEANQKIDDAGVVVKPDKKFIDKYLEYVDNIHDNLTAITDLVMGE